MFLHGNSGKNIRDGSAYYTEKDKQISKAIFGLGSKDPAILGQGVYKNYGIGEVACKLVLANLHYIISLKMLKVCIHLSECIRMHKSSWIFYWNLL